MKNRSKKLVESWEILCCIKRIKNSLLVEGGAFGCEAVGALGAWGQVSHATEAVGFDGIIVAHQHFIFQALTLLDNLLWRSLVFLSILFMSLFYY